jgi:hypothetical protein
MFQKPFFTVQSSGITGQGTIAADNPVTMNHNPKGILSVRGRNGADGLHIVLPQGMSIKAFQARCGSRCRVD